MNDYLRFFALPTLIGVLLLIAVYIWGGVGLFVITSLLIVLEVTLSFDNAVINAGILSRMTSLWQKRFLTWGMLIAVVGTRLILPILIVAISVSYSPFQVALLALTDPGSYGALLDTARQSIAAFGGTFLLLVSLKYFFDEEKTVHWIRFIEEHVATWGHIEALEVGVALAALLGAAFLVPTHAFSIVSAGIVGILLFICMQGIVSSFTLEASGAGSLALFLYLNILDAAFSLDGVVGAFAITDQIIAIIIGLGVGAYIVRSLTVYLVEKKTLSAFPYLEHGAHWAILGLALSLYASIFVHVPEEVTGLLGLVFVGAAYYTSIRKREALPVP